MYKIINVKDYEDGLEKGVAYIHGKWGNDNNYSFYLDAIHHSPVDKGSIPMFYLLLCQKEIVGCYGLIANDFISRHDLMPWFSSLYIGVKNMG